MATTKKAAKKTAEKVRSEVVRKTEDLLKSGREKFEQIDFDPIWKRVKTGLEGAVKALGTGTEKATEKTVAMAKRAGVEYQIYEQNHQLRKLLAELGGKVYDLVRRSPQALSPDDPEIIDMVAKITDMEKKIAALEEKSKAHTQ